MLRSAFSLCLTALLAGSLLGCNKSENPQPNCYSGTVVANSCMAGPLINVDAAYAIGAPAASAQGNRFLGNNVVAVANSGSLGSLSRVGQRVYFTYRTASRPPATRYCLDNDDVTTPVPYLELSNVSVLDCDSARSH
jgi:hypothetical protein